MVSPEQMVEGIAAVWLTLTGLALGSFLNVVIARVPEGLSIVHPRSRCPRCGHRLPWYENIPVLSWLALRGKCSSCKLPISVRYPLIELLTAGLFVLCLWRFGWTWELLGGLILVLLLVPLAMIDLDFWILPFELTLPGIVFGILTAVPLGLERVVDSVLGTCLGFALFFALEKVGRAVFKQEALGGGDKYLLALLGGFLTWRGIGGVVLLSSLQGSVYGITLRLLTGRAGHGDAPLPEKEGDKTERPSPDGDPHAAAGGSGTQANPEEDDWVPGPSNLQFGPWLAVAGLQLLFLGPWLQQHLPWPLNLFLAGP